MARCPITVMAVAPDFHTDFLTVERVRHARTPTTPSWRGGIILRLDIFYHSKVDLSIEAREELV